MIDYLEWDSAFLGYKTGRINLINQIDVYNHMERAYNENYKLIYLFTEPDYFVSKSFLIQYNGKLVDRKVVYIQDVSAISLGFFGETELYKATLISDDLLQLAYESGKHSRFKLDKSFSDDVFKGMYKIWVENSINNNYDDKVFIIKNMERIVSMVTVKIKLDTLLIGLIATESKFQGNGFGRQLLNRVKQTAKELELKCIEVPTQLNNKQACKFYEASGFKIKSISNIYHFWL